MKRELHDGMTDGLTPLQSLDLSAVDSFADLVEGMSRTAFGGRHLGDALQVLLKMADDPDCQVVLTVSGAMTVAKQGQILCELIDRGLVNAVVATGALIAHGLTESIGLVHYRHDGKHSDQALFERGYNRIYDTLEMEANLNDVSELIASVVNPGSEEVWSSYRFCRVLGQRLCEAGSGTGILRSACLKNVPVFIPAFTDSEIGLDLATLAVSESLCRTDRSPSEATLKEVSSPVPSFNPFLDLQTYARLACSAPRLGILTIGGGVPRNWAQQVGPYIDVMNARLGTRHTAPRFQYGVRICPEPAHWGGLSGCTYSEGVSWGKFVPPEEGGLFAEVPADATIALPLLMKALFERLDARPDE